MFHLKVNSLLSFLSSFFQTEGNSHRRQKINVETKFFNMSSLYEKNLNVILRK